MSKIDSVEHLINLSDKKSQRRYEGPKILHRETVEAMAADCSFPGGKSDPTCSVGFS